MRFGVTIFATDQSMEVPELARAAEDRGFDSIWIPSTPTSPPPRRTPPPTGDAELAEEYKRTIDPLIALAVAASTTSTIRLGTGVMLPAQRESLVTAKAIATLQNLAGGRFEFGVGFGWNEDEMADHGVDYRTWSGHARDHMLAMQALWTDEVAALRGTVRVHPADLVLAQARGARAGAARRRRGAEDVRPHRGVRERLDPDRGRRARRLDPEVPRGDDGRRPRSPTRCASSRSGRTRARTSSTTPRRSASPSASSDCPRRHATRCCPCSTSRPDCSSNGCRTAADRGSTLAA